MKRVTSLLFMICVSVVMCAQTQQGYVKTKGRLGGNGAVVKGSRLSGAVITVKGGNAVVSSRNGTFSLSIPNNSYFLQSVQKQGYVLTDPDVLSKQYSYSKNPLVLVLEPPSQQTDDRLAAERKIRRTLQRQLQEREDEIESLKEQKRLSEEEYRKQLQELYDQQENNDKLISEMADRYSKMDFDEIDEFNRRISSLILEGRLMEADSLLNTKGSIDSRTVALRQHQEANALERQEVSRRQKRLAKSEALAQQELEDLARDCYSKYEIFKMQYQNDSAAHYIAIRANLDTTNTVWQDEAAIMYQSFLCDYATARQYCMRSLRHNIEQNGENSASVGRCYQNIGIMYKAMQQYDKAMECFQKALSILTSANGQQEDIADANIFIGTIYQERGDYVKALDCDLKAYDILKTLDHPKPAIMNRAYTVVGNVYSDTGDYAHAEEYLQMAVEHAEKEFEEFREERAVSYQNLGRIKKLQRHFDEAMKLYQKALNIYQTIFGEKHEATGSVYSLIGTCLVDSGKNDGATPYLQKALDIMQRVYGEQSLQVAICYQNMGANFGYAKQYEKSLEYYRKSHDIFLSFLGPDHPNMGGVYLGMGSMYNELGNYLEAKKYILKSVEILRKTYGDDYPYRKEIEEGLVELEEKMAKQAEK